MELMLLYNRASKQYIKGLLSGEQDPEDPTKLRHYYDQIYEERAGAMSWTLVCDKQAK